MTLVRVWTRHLYGASVVAVLAPTTMIAVLAVLALGGGFGGLSALGQLLSGPAVPVGSSPPGGQVAPRGATLLLPVVPASAATRSAPLRGPATSPPAPGASRSRGGSSSAGGSSGSAQRVASGGHGATPPVTAPPNTPRQPAPPVSTPTPTPALPTATAPVRALVNQVIALGVSMTSQLPAPVAAIGTGALESAGQTLNTLLAPQP